MKTYKTSFWKSASPKTTIMMWICCVIFIIAFFDLSLIFFGFTIVFICLFVWLPMITLNYVTIMGNYIIVGHYFFDSWGGVYKYEDITKIDFRFPYARTTEAYFTIHRKKKRRKNFLLGMVSSSDFDKIICDLVRNGVVVEVIHRAKKLVIPD